MTTCRRALISLIWLSVAALPATAAAQTPPGAPREGFGVAVMFTVQGMVGRVLSVRVTQPVHEKVAFDFDIGWKIPSRKDAPATGAASKAAKPGVGPKWRASGLVTGAHLRWLPKGRSETGWSAALITGAQIMHSGTYDVNNQRVAHAWVIVPDWAGLTVDKLSDNGYRIGGAVGGISAVPFELFTDRLQLKKVGTFDSQFPMFYAQLFGAWVDR